MDSSLIVGLDLGDGESTLAYCVDQESLLPAVPNNTAIPSIIAFERTGRTSRGAIVGLDALGMELVERLEVNFKLRPGADPAAWMRHSAPNLLAFAEAMMESLRQSVPWDRDTSKLQVGCPAGWDADDIRTYREVLMRSTSLPRDVDVLPESHSVLVQAVLFEGLAQLVQDRTVVVVDVGSSTTDVSVLRRGRLVDDDGRSAELGLAELDETLLKLVVRRVGDRLRLRELFKQNASWWNLTLLLCRIRKELAFGGEARWPIDRLLANRPWAEEVWSELSTLDPVPLLTTSESDAGSWLARYELLVERVAAEFDGPDCVVVLTGGGVHIEAIRDATGRAFAAAEMRISRDPELGVARGLASYGRLRTWERQLVASIKEYLATTTSRERIHRAYPGLYRQMLKFWGEHLVEAVWVPMADMWRRDELNLSTRGRFDSFALGLFQDWMNHGGKGMFDEATRGFVRAVERAVEPAIDEVRTRYPMSLRPFTVRLDISPLDLYSERSPASDELTAGAFQILAPMFHTVDRMPDWVRRALGGRFLDAMLAFEAVAQRLQAWLASVLSSSTISDELQQRFDAYVYQAISEALYDSLLDIRMLLLEGQDLRTQD